MNTATKATTTPKLEGLALEIAQQCALDRYKGLDYSQILHLAINGATNDIQTRSADLLFDLFESNGQERFELSQNICLLLENGSGQDYDAKALDSFKAAQSERQTPTPVHWAKFLKSLNKAEDGLINEAFSFVYNGKLLTRTDWFEVAKTFGNRLAAEKALEFMLGDCPEDNDYAWPKTSDVLDLPWPKFRTENQILLLEYFKKVPQPQNKELERAANLITDEPTKKELLRMLFRQTDKSTLISLLGLPVKEPFVPEPGEEFLK